MRWATAAGLMVLLSITGLALGKSEFRQYVPGGTVPGATSDCQTCHVAANPTSGLLNDLNDFGKDVRLNLTGGVPDWKTLFRRDADRDGYTNGVELGDPSGQWRPGPTDLRGALSHPGDAQSKPSRPSSVESRLEPTAWAVIKTLFRKPARLP